jgi:hypothetical protein
MRITEHYRKRGIKRGLFPGWLSTSTINRFTMQKLNQTQRQRISKSTGMLINVCPGMTIVTTLDRKTAITTWKNKVGMVS